MTGIKLFLIMSHATRNGDVCYKKILLLAMQK